MMSEKYPYQWRSLLLMVMAWGFAGVVHNCVSFLFPYFSEHFQLNTGHDGYLTGTLAFFWTLSILYCGPLSDRRGQVKVMAPGLCLGGVALLALAVSGSLVMLYVFTALAGLGCGSIVSSSFSFLAEQSDPKYRGLFFGTAQSSFTLIGSAIGSVVFTRLGATAIGWRGCYLITAILVLFAAAFIFFGGRHIPRAAQQNDSEDAHSFRELLAYKNVVLSALLASLTMMWYFTAAAFTILYLMEAKNLSEVAAGVIFAGFGSGGFIGEFCAPFISDRLGRKSTTILAVTIGGGCFAAFVLLPLSAMGMTLALAGASCFMSGAMAILNSVVPSESVPLHLVATATAFIPAYGELMGGVIAPVITGGLSGAVGTSQVMVVLAVLPVLVWCGLFFLKETAPAVLARRSKQRPEGM